MHENKNKPRERLHREPADSRSRLASEKDGRNQIQLLDENEGRFRRLFMSLFEGFGRGKILFDETGNPHDILMLETNEAFVRIVGLDTDQVRGSTFLQLFPGTGPSWIETLVTASRNGEPIYSQLLKKWFTIYAFSPGPDELACLFIDATERKQAEQALRESEGRFRTMANGLPLIIWVHDAQGEQQFVNQTFLDFFGVTLDEMKGDRWRTLMHPDDAEAHAKEFIDCVRDQRPFHSQVRVRRADGEWRWLESWARPRISSSGEYLGHVGASADITERKQAEKELQSFTETLEQKIAERTELAEARAGQLQRLANELIEAEDKERRRFAHLLHDDLQQILAAARMQLETVSSDDPTLKNVKRMLAEAIAKSRGLSHQLSPPVQHYSELGELLKWLAQQMKKQFNLNIDLAVHAEQRLENILLKSFIFRSVQELLFNIVKHAGVKNARIEDSCADGNLLITISDQGHGFDPSFLDNSVERSGFGLLSIRERASYIGGSFTIDSSPGKGSRFTLKIPVPEEYITVKHSAWQQPLPLEATVADSESKRIRVLFADDHKVMRKGLIQLLTRQPGIEIAGEAANGKKAVKLVQQLQPKPDVVLMDISMPVMDGIKATKLIKTQTPEVRVIGLSMHDDEMIAKAMRKAGAERLMSKSSSSAELIQAIFGEEASLTIT